MISASRYIRKGVWCFQHTESPIYIYIYICVCVCTVCMHVCMTYSRVCSTTVVLIIKRTQGQTYLTDSCTRGKYHVQYVNIQLGYVGW